MFSLYLFIYYFTTKVKKSSFYMQKTKGHFHSGKKVKDFIAIFHYPDKELYSECSTRRMVLLGGASNKSMYEIGFRPLKKQNALGIDQVNAHTRASLRKRSIRRWNVESQIAWWWLSARKESILCCCW